MRKLLKIAMNIVADYRYVYDPKHINKPNGNWKYTTSGWSNNLEQPEGSDYVPGNPTTTKKPALAPLTNKPEDSEDEWVGSEKATKENENLFSDEESKSSFVTDEEGKKEEVKNKSDDAQKENPDEENNEEDEELNLDVDEDTNEEPDGNQEEEGFDLNEDEGGEKSDSSEEPLFSDNEKEEYLSEEKYEEYLEKLNVFIEKFDESEGKDNNVTFKAVASNLDWDSDEEVKAFLDHCNKKKLEGANEALGFLYFYNKKDKKKFDKIIEDMK